MKAFILGVLAAVALAYGAQYGLHEYGDQVLPKQTSDSVRL